MAAILWRARSDIRRAYPASFIEPCLPTPESRGPVGPDWVHEIKHDAYRVVVRRDGPPCACSPAAATSGLIASPASSRRCAGSSCALPRSTARPSSAMTMACPGPLRAAVQNVTAAALAVIDAHAEQLYLLLNPSNVPHQERGDFLDRHPELQFVQQVRPIHFGPCFAAVETGHRSSPSVETPVVACCRRTRRAVPPLPLAIALARIAASTRALALCSP
jgi:hypothetical protein